MPDPIPVAHPNPDTSRAKIVAAALEAATASKGRAYKFGGRTTAGFDCSGFVSYVYQLVFPDFAYVGTEQLRSGGLFSEVTTPSAGDLIFFPEGENPFEVAKNNKRDFPNHVGIVLDAHTWIGSQSSTGVARVPMTSAWWKGRAAVYLRYKNLK